MKITKTKKDIYWGLHAAFIVVAQLSAPQRGDPMILGKKMLDSLEKMGYTVKRKKEVNHEKG